MTVLSLEQKGYRTGLARAIDRTHLRRDWISDEAGVHPTVLGYLIRGQRCMTTDYANRLAPVLGVTPEYLLGTEARE